MKNKQSKRLLAMAMALTFALSGVISTPTVASAEYSCAMKSHFRKSGNQMSGKWKSSYASLLA